MPVFKVRMPSRPLGSCGLSSSCLNFSMPTLWWVWTSRIDSEVWHMHRGHVDRFKSGQGEAGSASVSSRLLGETVIAVNREGVGVRTKCLRYRQTRRSFSIMARLDHLSGEPAESYKGREIGHWGSPPDSAMRRFDARVWTVITHLRSMRHSRLQIRFR